MTEVAAEGTACSSCGRVNRTGRKFCSECGTPLVVVCSTCGASNEPGERFCGECGSPLGGAAAGLEVAAALRDREKVEELLSLVESAAPGHLRPYARALGARFGAYRAAGQGDSATASAGSRAAAELLREIERPFELAVVLLEHAERLAAEGGAEEASALADEAREIFERLRAKPWLERLELVPRLTPEAVLD